MRPHFPWMKTAARDAVKVGLFSFGSVEVKIPLVLYSFLLSSDIALSAHKNFGWPENFSAEAMDEIKSSIQKENLKAVVFDIRVLDSKNSQNLRHARNISHSLRNICSDLAIESSAILSNGDQLIGNAVGVFFEMKEARDVLKGKGPPDLTKFTLEIGSDFLLMTNRVRQRIEAKKRLRDRIVSGKFTDGGEEISSEKARISSQEIGYVHHHVMKEILSMKSDLALAHPGIGFSLLKKPSDWIEKGDEIIEVYLPEGQNNPLDEEAFKKAYVISTDPPPHQPLILEKISPLWR